MGLFIPLILPVLGYLIYILHAQSPGTLFGHLVKWGLLEFFGLCFVFVLLFFISVTFVPGWALRALEKVTGNLVRWLACLFAVTAAANLVIWLINLIHPVFY